MVTFVHAKLVLSFFSRNWTTGFEISLYTLVKIKTRWQLPLSQQNLSKNICLDDNCQEYCINIRYFLPNFKQILFVSRKIYPAILSWWQLSPEVLSESRLGHFFDTDNKTKIFQFTNKIRGANLAPIPFGYKPKNNFFPSGRRGHKHLRCWVCLYMNNLKPD